jgi:membrane peptidoglycan carboxypeptidase
MPAKKTPSKAARPAPARTTRRPRWWLRILLALVALAGLGIIGFGIAVASTSVPTPSDIATSEATIVYWNDGATELGRLGESTRRSVALSSVPIDAQNAVLAAEDRDFYNHGGISPAGIARAALSNVRGDGGTQGGSTITQQYAKNAFLTQERSWTRKVKEALLAFKLETTVSKNEILENYLNSSYFGRGAYGIEAASLAYFGSPASELTVPQAALLAAVLKSPSTFDPNENRERLEERWNYVLDGMVEKSWLPEQDRARMTFPEVVEQKQKNRLGGQTGYLLNAVTAELVALGFDEQEVQRGGLRITSTFNQRAVRAAAQSVRKFGPKTGTEGLRIGLASVEPGTGRVIAMYGGRDFIRNQINNATRPFAQAGSTFKTFALAAAAEKEVPLNSTWPGNSPTTIKNYTFENYGNKSYGTVTLLTATEFSINSAYVTLEDDLGVDSVVDATLRAGIPETTPGLNLESPDLTFVLGTASPSALDVAGSYATFASGGTFAQPTFIDDVKGLNGGLLYERANRTQQAFSPDVAHTVSFALNKVVTNGTGRAALLLERPAAAKTGTTDDNKSAWFTGYTPELATSVVFAKEDEAGRPVSMSGTGGLTSVTGGSFPAAIWTAYMKAALEGKPVQDFPAPPDGIRSANYCPGVMPEDGVIPIGCPTPDVAEFGPSTAPDPTDLPVPTETPDAELVPEEPIEPEPNRGSDENAPEFGGGVAPGPGNGNGNGKGKGNGGGDLVAPTVEARP